MTTELATITNAPASIESYADNLAQKLSMATVLLKSGMLPTHYKSPESVLTAILYGRELGFSPIRALNSITVIQGKPTLEAQALKSLAIAHGGKIKTIEWNDNLCTLECIRGDWTDSVTYTWADATKAGLTTKDNWKRMPKPMLYARAVSTLVRNMFADILGGLYSREEMEDSSPVTIVRDVTPPKPLSVEEDEIPASFFVKPIVANPELPTTKTSSPSRSQQLKDAVDGNDIQYLGDWTITTRCSFNGVKVRDAYQQDGAKLRANASKLNADDKVAVTAFLDAITEDIEVVL